MAPTHDKGRQQVHDHPRGEGTRPRKEVEATPWLWSVQRNKALAGVAVGWRVIRMLPSLSLSPFLPLPLKNIFFKKMRQCALMRALYLAEGGIYSHSVDHHLFSSKQINYEAGEKARCKRAKLQISYKEINI